MKSGSKLVDAKEEQRILKAHEKKVKTAKSTISFSSMVSYAPGGKKITAGPLKKGVGKKISPNRIWHALFYPAHCPLLSGG
eukprot:CAMPEP_0113905502 /NCGR_PEP_ID=MMETSP0780_2-20120614/24063_1 /TAXON_ID=652834 /ORGANISM="Palpitomonas bilix" /LENGTH=80 /DNA_ID=CAMNT_0000899669 /DNA_START=175 /DNA_END=417 /DNA_ORIENTATION=+ /assembly_acc=CAM_ASM_000599